jgi:hypothetical protein
VRLIKGDKMKKQKYESLPKMEGYFFCNKFARLEVK